MTIAIRLSSTTSNGTPTAISLGGYCANNGPASGAGLFFDNVTAAQNDVGHTDYRCLFIYNDGTTVMNDVWVMPSNKGGGSTVTIAASSVATNTLAAYTTAVSANESTAPAITGSFGTSASLGTLEPGQVKAVWLKRVTVAKAAASTGDNATMVVSAKEVIPDA